MLTLQTVLPNFVKTAVFAAATTICFSAFAAHHEETEGTAIEGAAELTHAGEHKMADMKTEGSEVIGDLKDMSEEVVDEASEVEKTADMVAQ